MLTACGVSSAGRRCVSLLSEGLPDPQWMLQSLEYLFVLQKIYSRTLKEIELCYRGERGGGGSRWRTDCKRSTFPRSCATISSLWNCTSYHTLRGLGGSNCDSR